MKSLLTLGIGHAPDRLPVNIALFDLRGKRIALAQSNFPDYVVRFPAIDQRIGKGIKLLSISIGILGFDAGPTPNI